MCASQQTEKRLMGYKIAFKKLWMSKWNGAEVGHQLGKLWAYFTGTNTNTLNNSHL